MKWVFYTTSFAALLLAITASVAPCCCWFSLRTTEPHACCVAQHAAAECSLHAPQQNCHCQLEAATAHTAPELLLAPVQQVMALPLVTNAACLFSAAAALSTPSVNLNFPPAPQRRCSPLLI